MRQQPAQRPDIQILLLRRRNNRRLLLLSAALLFLAAGIFAGVHTLLGRERFGVLDQRLLVEIPADQLPEGTLYITPDRRAYQRGRMTLILPAIDVFTPVGESTTWEGLQEMPGLYEFAQLPGEGDVNVSIAGHRDIYDQVFYDLDRVEEGDFAYLLYGDVVYRYRYRDARVVSPTHWEVIQPQGFSCMTLTTCDPIGTSLNRLVVRWELVDAAEYSEDYRFQKNER